MSALSDPLYSITTPSSISTVKVDVNSDCKSIHDAIVADAQAGGNQAVSHSVKIKKMLVLTDEKA